MRVLYPIFLTLFFVFSCSSVADQKKVVEKKSVEFLSSLLLKDEKVLASKYATGSRTFTQDNKLNPEIFSFLYGEKLDGFFNVTSIVDTGDLHIEVVPQRDERYIVLFTKLKYKDDISNMSFLENQWMKKYFACEFELINDELVFYSNICFAETGGPFPSDYGI